VGREDSRVSKASPEYFRRWYRAHKDEVRERSKQWALDNPDKRRAISRRHQVAKYGLSPEEYDNMVAAQKGCCLICGVTPTRLHIDHDHTTDVVRGLLCNTCNAGLGQFKDSPDLLRAATKYVEERLVG